MPCSRMDTNRPLSNYDVIQDRDIQQTAGLDKVARHGKILWARGWIAARVIVNHNHPGSVCLDRFAENFAGAD